MDERGIPTTAPRRARRWRSPWLRLGLPALVLAILTIDVLVTGPLTGTDQRIQATVQTLANSPAWQWLWGPTRLIIQAADPVVAVTVLAVSALTVSALRRSLRPLLTAAVAVTLLVVTAVPAKILIGRLPPGQRFLPPGAMGAFPSGHTTTASVCYVLAVLTLLPYLPAWTRRIALAALAAWCLLVGFALVWQNLHWFTDVVAGWALAAIIIQATLRLTRAGRTGPGAPPGVADERIASASAT